MAAWVTGAIWLFWALGSHSLAGATVGFIVGMMTMEIPLGIVILGSVAFSRDSCL
jgi:hypothetical protein